MMAVVVPLNEAKPRLHELVRQADDEDVYLARHGQIACVMLAQHRYQDLLDEIEDLKDRLSVFESQDSDMQISLDKAKIELGLTG